MTELIEYMGLNIFDISKKKKNEILEFVGLKDYKDKKEIKEFIIRVQN